MAASKRLTEGMRDLVRRRVMGTRFEAREKGLRAEGMALGEAVYSELVPPANRRLMDRLPDAYFVTEAELRVGVKGERAGTRILPLPKPAPLPFFVRVRNVAQDDVSPEVWQRLLALVAAADALAREKERTEGELRAALAQFNTVAQLLEASPELAELCPELVAEKPLLPVCVSRLREIVSGCVPAAPVPAQQGEG